MLCQGVGVKQQFAHPVEAACWLRGLVLDDASGYQRIKYKG